MQDFTNVPSIHLFPITVITLDHCFGRASRSNTQYGRRIPAAVRTRIIEKVQKLIAACLSAQGDDLDELETLANDLLCSMHIVKALSNQLEQLTSATPQLDARSPPPPTTTTSVILSKGSTVHRTPATTPENPPRFVACNGKIRTKKQAEHQAKRTRHLPLTPKCELPGFIYAFRYPEEEGLLKIGYTTKDIEGRMKDIKIQCHRKPVLIAHNNQRIIPHVYRAEQIVFAKLGHLRLREVKCQGCGKSHIEWFEVDDAKALEVIERVRQYMEEKYGVVKTDEEDEGDEGDEGG